MSKNILVLTGSAKNAGNSDQMADAFILGVEKEGHTTVKYKTAEKTIGGCKACKACFQNGKACVFDDDFNELAPLLEKADVLVFATPVYCASFPAQLKAAIDKMYAFYIGKRPLKIKECILLACGDGKGGPDSYDGLIRSYELIVRYRSWSDRGQILISGVKEKGDILSTDGLQKAEALGRSLI